MIEIETGAADAFAPMVLYRNRLAEGALSATNTETGYFVENVMGPQTFDYWKASALPAEFSVTLAAAAEFDCFALVAHNLGTVAASVSVYYSATDVSAWVEIGTYTFADDQAAAVIFPAVTGQRFRLVFNSADAMPFVGVCFAGKRLVFPGAVLPPYVTAPNAARVDGFPSVSLGGQFLGSYTLRQGAELSAQFSPMPRAWIEGDFAAFRAAYDGSQPFFWAASPATFADDLAYCWRPDGGRELRPAFSEGALYASIAMELAAYAA